MKIIGIVIAISLVIGSYYKTYDFGVTRTEQKNQLIAKEELIAQQQKNDAAMAIQRKQIESQNIVINNLNKKVAADAKEINSRNHLVKSDWLRHTDNPMSENANTNGTTATESSISNNEGMDATDGINYINALRDHDVRCVYDYNTLLTILGY